MVMLDTLGRLADSSAFHEPLELGSASPSKLASLLRMMSLIRAVEEKLASGRREGLIGGPVHLGAGQEAIAVGVSQHLQASDRVFGAHRSHAHLLALGASTYGLFAEVLGRDTGHSRGMGGSMHLWDQSIGFYGSVPIVAGTVSLAVGAGLAAKLQGTGDVAVAYLGDGAVEEGVVHESLNFARINDVPVIFVVENNLFASHMHISKRQPSDSTARFAVANGIPAYVIDGNDVISVADAAEVTVARARSGGGPSFIEAVTYRRYGHVDWRDDIDVGVHRSQDDVASWKARDPISRLREAMIAQESWTMRQDVKLNKTLAAEIEDAWSRAMRDPYPEPSALLERVYAK